MDNPKVYNLQNAPTSTEAAAPQAGPKTKAAATTTAVTTMTEQVLPTPAPPN